MPYISAQLRPYFDEHIDDMLINLESMSPDARTGCLTYIIYKLTVRLTEGKGYPDKSRFRACIQDAHDEFYRRQLAPYEDEKINENGDVI